MAVTQSSSSPALLWLCRLMALTLNTDLAGFLISWEVGEGELVCLLLAATEQEMAMWRRPPIEKKWFNEEISEIYCRRSSASSFTIIIGLFKQNRFQVVKFMASASSSAAAAALTRVTSVLLAAAAYYLSAAVIRTNWWGWFSATSMPTNDNAPAYKRSHRNQSEMCNMSAINPPTKWLTDCLETTPWERRLLFIFYDRQGVSNGIKKTLHWLALDRKTILGLLFCSLRAEGCGTATLEFSSNRWWIPFHVVSLCWSCQCFLFFCSSCFLPQTTDDDGRGVVP